MHLPSIEFVAPNELLRFVVFSDLHIVPEGKKSKTLDTMARFEAGIQAVIDRHADWDFVVVAGDLADHGDIESYQRLKKALDQLPIPYLIAIGNHDHRENYLSVFGEENRGETDFIDYVRDVKGTRLIFIDSCTTGNHTGHIEQIQLDWLAKKLDEASSMPVIVILHHHVVPLTTEVDQIILQDSEALVDVLARHSDVRQVISGHVHYGSTAVWKGIPFTTLTGNHFSVTTRTWDSPEKVSSFDGPAQMLLVQSSSEQTVVHFDDYLRFDKSIPS